ncbi:hypothetical protein H4R19_003726 [Coemansia spiralis]|nr:hypothetical protein H4R19_003726 [Coemansia spiralis]
MDDIAIEGSKLRGKQKLSALALNVLILAKVKKCHMALVKDLHAKDREMAPKDDAIDSIALDVLLSTLDPSLHEIPCDKAAYEAWNKL